MNSEPVKFSYKFVLHIAKRIVQFQLLVCACMYLLACDTNELASQRQVEEEVIGYSNVSLNVDRNYIRSQESPVGNLIADAMLHQTDQAGFEVDFALVNAGGIRVDLSRHANSTYPAGDLYRQDILDMLPFGNTGVVVQLTAAQLKQIFERSVSQLPVLDSIAPGGFLQVSSNIRVTFDLNNQMQVIAADGTIQIQGSRVLKIELNGASLNPEVIYRAYLPSFIASGGDNYVTLKLLDSQLKLDTGADMAVYLEDYIRLFSPISPSVEQRLIFL